MNAHSLSLIYLRQPVRHIDRADSCESNINEYCSLDEEGGKPISQMTLGEKEQAFLEALSVRFVFAICFLPCYLKQRGLKLGKWN